MENNKNMRDPYMKDSLSFDQTYSSIDNSLQVTEQQIQIVGSNAIPEGSNAQVVYLLLPSQEGQQENLGNVPPMVLLPSVDQISSQPQQYYIPNAAKPVVQPNSSQFKTTEQNAVTNLQQSLPHQKPLHNAVVQKTSNLPAQNSLHVSSKPDTATNRKLTADHYAQKVVQPKQNIPYPLMKCDYPGCQSTFPTLYEKKLHTEVHLFPPSTSFKCSICDMVFDTAVERNRHIDSHAVVNTFKCKTCAKAFPYYVSLVKHVEEKKCVGLHRCLICDVRFASEADLEKHRKSNVKPCVCRLMFCGEEAFSVHASTCLLYKRSLNTANGDKEKQ